MVFTPAGYSEIPHYRVTFRQRDDHLTLYHLLDRWHLHGWVDLRIVFTLELSLHHANHSQLMLDVIQATEGDQSLRWLAHHVNVEDQFDI